jgi:hypothetical protein
MTEENRILFDLMDIRTIQFECKACHSRFVCPPDKWAAMPMYCGNCKEPLLQGLEYQTVEALKQCLKDLLRFSEGSKLIIRFEISN